MNARREAELLLIVMVIEESLKAAFLANALTYIVLNAFSIKALACEVGGKEDHREDPWMY